MSDELNLHKSVVLVGMMGAGKTTIGSRLAKKLNMPFRDTDEEVIKYANCSIEDIFKYQGEPYFRQKETEVVRLLLNQGPQIIATGDGAFITPENREMVKKRAISIWIKADFDVLYERVSRRRTRPLLEVGDKKEILKDLIHTRYEIYKEADFTVESDLSPHYMIVDMIIAMLKNAKLG